MGRRPRLDLDGFHHIVNRSVARNSIYRGDEDKEKFLEILCKWRNTSKTITTCHKETLLYLKH